MKNSRKRYTRHIFSFIVICLILSSQINAQTDRDELKLQNLKNKIAMAEEKVAAAESRLAKADSLITSGDLRIIEAEEEYELVREEQKRLEKEYRTNSKELNKLARSKDAETAVKAKNDLKALNVKYKEESKLNETKIKNLTRNAAKARSDIDKGLDMEKDANIRLKDAQKTLELARENYEDFMNTLESE